MHIIQCISRTVYFGGAWQCPFLKWASFALGSTWGPPKQVDTSASLGSFGYFLRPTIWQALWAAGTNQSNQSWCMAYGEKKVDIGIEHVFSLLMGWGSKNPKITRQHPIAAKQQIGGWSIAQYWIFEVLNALEALAVQSVSMSRPI